MPKQQRLSVPSYLSPEPQVPILASHLPELILLPCIDTTARCGQLPMLTFVLCDINIPVPLVLALDVLQRYGIVLDFGPGYVRGKDRKLHLTLHYSWQHDLIAPYNPCAIQWMQRELDMVHL